MFSSAKSYTFSPEFPSSSCVFGCIRVSSDTKLSDIVGPQHQLLEIFIHFSIDGGNLAEHYFSSSAVNRDIISLLDRSFVHGELFRLVVDIDCTTTCYGRFSHSSSNYCSVRSHSATGR